MAQLFSHVNSGDLITAQSFNEILDKLHEMETRLELLESGGDTGSLVSITRFLPVTEQHIGRTLEIIGSNFEIPARNNSVTVDGVPVTRFGVSTVELLRIILPNISGTPKNTEIKITNRHGSMSRLYRVLEEVPVVGDPPSISDIVGPAGGVQLVLGQSMTINGENFSTPVTLRLRSREPGHTSDIFDITSIGTVSATQISATLPRDIPLVQAPLFPGGPVRPDNMEIELTMGAFDPVLQPVQVIAA